MNCYKSRSLCRIVVPALFCCILFSCKKGVKQQDDELYSRHLQRKVTLTVIHTPIPDDKSAIHLLVCNDGQLLKELNIAAITDSLYRKKSIPPLVIVGVHAGNRSQEYGVADQAGTADAGGKADHYDSFFNNELYPFVKKNAGVRKFKSVVVAGFGAGGLSALDLAWSHADKINRVAAFSSAFSLNNKKSTDTVLTGMMFEKLKSSRKRPHLQYWFYAGATGTTGLPNEHSTRIMAATDSIISLLKNKTFIADADITYHHGQSNDVQAWKQELPFFLEWAFE